jgi:hypothetical protein
MATVGATWPPSGPEPALAEREARVLAAMDGRSWRLLDLADAIGFRNGDDVAFLDVMHGLKAQGLVEFVTDERGRVEWRRSA